MKSARVVGYMYLALAMIGVGSTIIVSKIISRGLPPFSATTLRFAIAFPVFFALMRLTRTLWPRPGRRDWLLLILQASAGSVGYTVLLISGMRLAPAVDGGIIAGTLPAVAAATAIVVLRDRPNRMLLAGIALASVGVVLITLRGNGGSGISPAAVLGNALVFGAVVCEALFILLNKRLRVPIAPLAQSTLMCGIGLVVAAVPALIERPWLGAWSRAALSGVVYYALVPTVIGFLLWFAGAARVSGGEASLFTAFAPVSAVVMAVTILGEPLGLAQIAGITCVLGAVVLATGGMASARYREGAKQGRYEPGTRGG